MSVYQQEHCVHLNRKKCNDDDDELTQRDKMSSESPTGAKFDDPRCHWFPAGASLMCVMLSTESNGDEDQVAQLLADRKMLLFSDFFI